jgi:hypothetical protein
MTAAGKVDSTLAKFSDAADNLRQASSNIDQVVISNQDDIHRPSKISRRARRG